jgi:RHS repeat-associated protein
MANPDTVPPDADLSFTYDASDMRVRKTSGDRHTLYVFGSLELRTTEQEAGEYKRDAETEVPYLFAHGVRLARVVHATDPQSLEPTTRVFLELGDHLGSTSVVLDRASGELVERSTAYAYGAVESDYRPGRWEEFREDYRFTGKEDDVEVGLIYFGKRYYAPLLQRWISADPLAVHSPGEADLNLYAYVHGKVLVAVDPVGLTEPQQSLYGGEEYGYSSVTGVTYDPETGATTAADTGVCAAPGASTACTDGRPRVEGPPTLWRRLQPPSGRSGGLRAVRGAEAPRDVEGPFCCREDGSVDGGWICPRGGRGNGCGCSRGPKRIDLLSGSGGD